ncbi:MAG: hypothetical protein ACRCZ9_08825 [Fusobacteriaceae bacterium]
MSFKEMLYDDIEAIFLNLEEFSEELEVEGTIVKGILDYKEDITSSVVDDGITTSDIAVLYVAKVEFFSSNRFKRGKSIEINDETFRIEGVGKHDGLLAFKLNKNVGF